MGTALTTTSEAPPRTRASAATAEHDAQVRLLQLVHWIDTLDEELQRVYAALPPPAESAAAAMEEQERPESLSHYLRTAIECTRRDWLAAARATLDRAVAMRQADLDLEWLDTERAR
jgi:hypothetical protein